MSLTFLVLVAPARAAFVTTNEAVMDAIFSQASFGNDPIDIRFGPITTFVRPDLLTVNNVSDLGGLFTIGPNIATTTNFYFIDSINWCGFTNPNFVGCASIGSKGTVIESIFSSEAKGGPLNAHELGHNLGLSHDLLDASNLMFPTIKGGTES